MKEFIWKKSGKVKNLYGTCEGFSKKMKSTYGKMLNLTEQVKEFIWKNDEFVRTSERIYMVQRCSKYRFFDVNCILRYSKYRFSSSIPGMPGEAKISIPYSMWVEGLIYIYMCCNVFGCSECGGLHS